jgi:cytochrome c oxidase subunit 2
MLGASGPGRVLTNSHILQSGLDSAGRQAASIQDLWWFMFWITSAVFALVLGAVAAALFRGSMRRRGRLPDATSEAMLTAAVSAAVTLTIGILLVLLVASVWTGRATASLGASSAVSISITGHQWWWEVEYEDAMPSRRVTTANEIHIPTGRPVVFKVASHDVIHSFWAPNLHGKRDLIPGYVTALWLQADRPGTYRGQCAEFCGREHAQMAFEIVAESDAEFERWLEDQRQPAIEPQSDVEQHGRAVFLAGRCATCHTIRGTGAYATVGPDLTHLASREKLAAGTLPNTRGHLAGWILDPQTIKPGTAMPANPLDSEDLHALIGYLEILR